MSILRLYIFGYQLPDPGYLAKNSAAPATGRMIDMQGLETGNW